MNQVEKLDKLIPKIAEHRVSDLFSETSSPAAKGNAARWYAEMFIDLFLSQRVKDSIGEVAFRKLSLVEMIDAVQGDLSQKTITALYDIKNFGDKASHYSPDTVLEESEAKRVVDVAMDLVVHILADELRSNRLDINLSRARIFSTIFPGIRERVLSELVDFSSPLDEYNLALLHKYCLACTKNNKFNKARRKLDELHKKGFINPDFHMVEIESIKEIARRVRGDQLPIPKIMEDVSRNFSNVLDTMPEAEKHENERLISILGVLVRDVFPSDMAHYVGDQIFIVGAKQDVDNESVGG